MKTIGNRYVVVDLEATSTGSKAKIIQVGIVVIEDGKNRRPLYDGCQSP